MGIATGALLVLVTWVVVGLVVLALGSGPVSLTRPRGRSLDLRASLWTGVALLTVLSVGLSLTGPVSRLAAWGAVLVTAGVSVSVATLRSARPEIRGLRVGRRWWPLLAACVLAILYLAVAALGPVTNYDSGLYHFGAVRYAAEFGALPGLANLYFPLGYASSEFTVAALMSGGPWASDGYRLVNGFIIALACVDLWMRLRQGKRVPEQGPEQVPGRGPGVWVLACGLALLLIPMVALSDYWVTSPSQDSAVFALTVVASAAVADVAARTRMSTASAVVGATGITLLLIRPTTLAFVVPALGVVAINTWRAKTAGGAGSTQVSNRTAQRVGVMIGVIAIMALVVSLVRDRFLSGWAMYPLSILPFDVEWRAEDPTPFRNATLGYHRNPEDIWGALDGWDWIPGWFARLPTMWESWLVLVAGLGSLGLLLLAHHRRVKALALALVPSMVATLAWFIASPPSFRFAWGPVLMIPATVAGWAAWRLGKSNGERSVKRVLPTLLASGVIAVTLVSAVLRLDVASMTQSRTWGPLEFVVAPVAVPDTSVEVTHGGIPLSVPVGSEQCWSVWPWCTPLPDSNLRFRGENPESGLVR